MTNRGARVPISRRLRVGVLFGGRSGEHEVSLRSARNVMAALDPDRYEVVPIGISKAGIWLSGPEVHARLSAAAGPGAGDAAAAEAGRDVMSFSEALVPCGDGVGHLDVVFPVLHGPMGEDGTIQGLLELADLPYVGCGVAASAAAMDKAIAKDVFRAHGLPVVAYRPLTRARFEADAEAVVAEIESALRYPMFVKPANLGSSVGINRVTDRAGLRAGLEEAALYDRRLIIEQGIDARDIEVSVLGNEAPRASVAGEIIPSREFYSYAAKYLDDSSQLLIPAPLDESRQARVRALAIAAYRALDCAGLARVDFLIERASGEVYVNEVNTIPGFTAISMYPKLWQASGVSNAELVDTLIELALQRYEDKRRTRTSFDPSTAR
jgi:D-alanine-D-alanine ligase